MTMMMHLLIRLHGDEDWEAWGDRWWDHVDQVGELWGVEGWLGPPAWLRERESGRQLDWGAFLYDGVTKADVQRLVSSPRFLLDSDVARQQRSLLEGLSEDERYGVVYVEVY